MELMKALSSRMEAHVVAIDYRGFADSTGWPSEAGMGWLAAASNESCIVCCLSFLFRGEI